MSEYGQFCPIAKASELLGERWTILILRELLLGTHRYSEFQRTLSRISPFVTDQAAQATGTELASLCASHNRGEKVITTS